ncbi:MAG: hypothetical protein QOG43_2403 [Actinomycetota bacterium]|jgi:hypothetical protein|nr:hypothetical protein [Actinomycetota bacterium]
MSLMESYRRSSRRPVAAFALAVLVLLGACSSDQGSSGTTATTSPEGDLIVDVASYDVAVGPPARILVGVQSGDQQVLAFGTVAVRFTFLGTKDAPLEAPAAGPPVTATYLPIPGTPDSPVGVIAPQMVSGAQARGVYGASVGFDKPGFWQAAVTVPLDGKERRGTGAFEVLDRHVIPAVGSPAPRSQNLTMDSPPDVPRGGIDSRAGSDGSQPIPDPELHQTTVAAALDAGRPVVAVIATPVYCTSRFCGPVTDMVQELSHVYGDRATFIHIEVWRDFQNSVVNKAAAEWIFPDPAGGLNEPWVFVIGGDGVITARFDNVATRAELEPLLQALPVLP